MKLPPSSSHRAFAAGRLVSLFAAAVAFAPLSQAQAASDRRAAADDSKEIVELPPFAVVAGTGDGYRETMSTVGTRTNRPVMEIPQSITMITGKMLEDTLAFREEEALRYVPNVFPRNTYGQPGEYLIRGFEREGSTYLDGFSVPGYRRDSAGYEHMEVIKGPPSAVQGRSGASGAINWISKKPVHGKNSLNTKITYSTDDGYEEVYRAVVDGNQTLIDKGVGRRLSVRAVGVYQEGNSMIQYLPDDRRGFYPSVRWDITPKTELTFFGEFLDATEPASNIGTGPSFYARDYRDLLKDPVLGGDPNDPISALDIPFGRNPAGPHVIHWEEIRSGIVSITHRFTDNIHFRQGYQRFTEYDERRTGEPAAALTQVTDVFNGQPGVWVPASYGGAKRRSARDSFQGDLYGQFNLTHTIRSTTLVGYEYWNYKEYKASHAYTLNPAYRRMNLANIPTDRSYWDDDKVIQSFGINDTDDDRIKNVSYYAQQEVDFWNRRLIASAAWRHDEQESWDLDDDGTIIETDDGTDSFRYGLTAFLNEKRTIAAYAVVSDAQDPELVRNVYSDGLAANDPRVDEKLIFRPGIELLEFGVKAELLDNRLSVSAAWFKQTMINNLLRTGNMPVESPIGSGNIVSVNRASLADSTVEGWEFQAVGDLTQRFSVVTSLAFMDSSEVRLLDTGPITQEMHRVADWNFNFFGRYDLRNERGNGFELRAGVNSYGPFIGTFSGIRLPVEHNFKQFDAGVRYTYGKNSIDFFVKNLTDEPIFIMRSTGGRAYRVTVSRTW
jgi:Outer membrane receptor proteins, mostly Fe transport